MATKIRVGDVMTRNFVHTHPDTSLMDCARKMIKNRVGSIVVKEGNKLHGIVTEKDIIWALTKKSKDFETIPVKDFARRKMITIKPEATLDLALEKMNKFKIRRMPVLSKKKIIGYITLKDMVKFMPEIFEQSRGFEKLKEESQKAERSKSVIKGESIEAPCEECGNFDILEGIDGRMICESCKDEM
ncbi:MAG: CBS domain-containing protein [Nanoarchaeota archaeon]